MKIYALMATYNPDSYLKTQINSILENSDVYILIRDDGSTCDKSKELLEYYNLQERITVKYGENLGLPGSFFELIQIAPDDGTYYFFADQDDKWLSNKIDMAIRKMDTLSSSIRLYLSRTILVDDDLNEIGLSKKLPIDLDYRMSIASNIATGCTMCMNSDLFKLIKMQRSNYIHIHMHDWWIYIVSSFLGDIYVDNDAYIYYRQHNNNNVGMKQGTLARTISRIMRIFKGDSKFNKITSQTQEFFEVYRDKLSDEQKSFLIDFLNRNKSLTKRVKYLLGNNISSNTKIDTLIIKILLFIGVIK